jgi:hypothetical protein
MEPKVSHHDHEKNLVSVEQNFGQAGIEKYEL